MTVTENETETNQFAITRLRGQLAGVELGPEPNVFGNSSQNRQATDDELLAYSQNNAEWLADYDADDNLHVLLVWNNGQEYQRRVNGVWTKSDRVTIVESIQALDNRITENTGDIGDNETSITTIQTAITDLRTTLGTKADTTALTLLRNRLTASNDRIDVNQDNIVLLEALLDGVVLGTAPNTFVGSTLAEAASARNDYAASDAAWLGRYDANSALHIRLVYGGTITYQHRVSGAWETAANVPVSRALQLLNNMLTQTNSRITQVQTALTNLSSNAIIENTDWLTVNML